MTAKEEKVEEFFGYDSLEGLGSENIIDNETLTCKRDIKQLRDISQEENNNNNNSHQSIAEILVKLVEDSSKLFKDEFEIPYALLKINNHYEVLSIEGSKFESYLYKIFYDNCKGKTANAEAINNAIRTLSAKAIFEGQNITLHLKVAWSNPDSKDSIYYDLADEERRCIKISKDDGWKIMNNQIEVLFKRYGHEASQVEPSHEYDSTILDNVIDSLNIKNINHKLLVKVWIISLLIPDIPIPILLPNGSGGSAKSTLQKKIKMLIDPSKLDLLSIYNDKTQFIQQISHNYLCFYDNVRYEPNWLSDEACRIVTGAGFSKRKNYTDDEDFVYTYKRKLSFSGINIIFTQEDALDRSINIGLDRIEEEDRITETKIDLEFRKQIPTLLGYIFDVLSKALEIKDSVNLKRLPRMADFAEWGEAIARALGYKPLEFLHVYFENIGERNLETIESDSWSDTLHKLFQNDAYDNREICLIDSPLKLVQYIKEFADQNGIDSSKFPTTANSCTRRLNKIKGIFKEGPGIEIIIDRIKSGNKGGGSKNKMNTTLIKIRKVSPVSPVSPVSENEEGNEVESTGDIKITGDNTSNEIIISPVSDDQTCAQFSSDIANIGGIGDTGDNLNIPHIEIAANSNFNFNYRGNNLYNKIEQYLSMGKSLKCHHKNCNNKEYFSLNDYNIHCHSSHPKQPMYPELSLIKMMGLEPKGNPWE